MPLNCILKNGLSGDFYLYRFYYNFFKKKLDTKIHIIYFHLYEFLEQAKSVDGKRSGSLVSSDRLLTRRRQKGASGGLYISSSE